MRFTIKCKHFGCEKIASDRGWCRMHYTRWSRHGNPETVKRYDRRTVSKRTNGTDYILVRDGNGYKFEHVALAESALGKPLPKGAVVHHVDRDGTNNNTKSAWNLVLCPDQSYHLLLHARARALGYEGLRSSYRLTVAQCREIRASGEPKKLLAQRYGVTISTIKEARSGRKAERLAKMGINL